MKKVDFSELVAKATQNISPPLQEVSVISNKKRSINEGSKQIAFYISEDLYKKVKKLAFEQEVSIKSILNESIEKYIKDIS